MKRKRPRTLKSLVAGLESGKVPLRRCGSPACRSCELSPPCVFPYPTQCLARRIAEATSQPAKRVNAYIVTQRQRRAEKPNYFYFALHKARGLGSMRRRGGGGCAARPCRDWATPAGCRFGDKCRFLHGSGDNDGGGGDVRGHRTAYDALPAHWPAVPHVGRLDVDTEGLLLFTDDGRLLSAMTDPTMGGYSTAKFYAVEVTRGGADEGGANGSAVVERSSSSSSIPSGSCCVDDAALRSLRKPLTFDGAPRKGVVTTVTTKAARAELHPTRRGEGETWVRITICEGKNRQVRRLCKRAGLRVRRLVRESIGTIELGDLPLGGARALTKSEVGAVYARCLPDAIVPRVLPLLVARE